MTTEKTNTIIFTIVEAEHNTFTIKSTHYEFQHLNYHFVEMRELFEVMSTIAEIVNNEYHKAVLFEVE